MDSTCGRGEWRNGWGLGPGVELMLRDRGCEGKDSGCCNLLKAQLWEGAAGRLVSRRGSAEPGKPGGRNGPGVASQVWRQVQEPAAVWGREGPAASPSSRSPFHSQGDFPLLPRQSPPLPRGEQVYFYNMERWERGSKGRHSISKGPETGEHGGKKRSCWGGEWRRVGPMKKVYPCG